MRLSHFQGHSTQSIEIFPFQEKVSKIIWEFPHFKGNFPKPSESFTFNYTSKLLKFLDNAVSISLSEDITISFLVYMKKVAVTFKYEKSFRHTHNQSSTRLSFSSKANHCSKLVNSFWHWLWSFWPKYLKLCSGQVVIS